MAPQKVEFAQRLAHMQGIEVPPEALEDRGQLSEFIDNILEERREAGTENTMPPTDKQVKTTTQAHLIYLAALIVYGVPPLSAAVSHLVHHPSLVFFSCRLFFFYFHQDCLRDQPSSLCLLPALPATRGHKNRRFHF